MNFLMRFRTMLVAIVLVGSCGIFAEPTPEELAALNDRTPLPLPLKQELHNALAPLAPLFERHWQTLDGLSFSSDTARVASNQLEIQLRQRGFRVLGPVKPSGVILSRPEWQYVVKIPGVFDLPCDDGKIMPMFMRILYADELRLWAHQENLPFDVPSKWPLRMDWKVRTPQGQERMPEGGYFVLARKADTRYRFTDLTERQLAALLRLINEKGYVDPSHANIFPADATSERMVIVDTERFTHPKRVARRIAAFFLYYSFKVQPSRSNLIQHPDDIAIVAHLMRHPFETNELTENELDELTTVRFIGTQIDKKYLPFLFKKDVRKIERKLLDEEPILEEDIAELITIVENRDEYKASLLASTTTVEPIDDDISEIVEE